MAERRRPGHELGVYPGALDLAVEEIKQRKGFDIPVIDSGMERVGGTPEVATIMFDKIRAAAIFVGDVSLVGEIRPHGNKPTKKTANPNVLMEMAYAGAKLGWQRVICVMNQAFGRAEKLPVDIRNRRWPVRYKMPPDEGTTAEQVKAKLVEDLKVAIEAIIYVDDQAVADAVRRFDSNCISVVAASRFHPSFHPPPANQVTFGSATGMDTLALNAAIPRLLDLGLIHCDFDSRQGLFAYHWTWLGQDVDPPALAQRHPRVDSEDRRRVASRRVRTETGLTVGLAACRQMAEPATPRPHLVDRGIFGPRGSRNVKTR